MPDMISLGAANEAKRIASEAKTIAERAEARVSGTYVERPSVAVAQPRIEIPIERQRALSAQWLYLLSIALLVGWIVGYRNRSIEDAVCATLCVILGVPCAIVIVVIAVAAVMAVGYHAIVLPIQILTGRG